MSKARKSVTENFQGHIGRTWQESEPWWPTVDNTEENRPNILIVLFDDLGFGSLGCYGSNIATPHIDALASKGLLYNNFHTTALCSPTRASLLTGRDHHAVGMSTIANADSGFPSKRGVIRHNAGTIAEILREQGFSTYAIGKWHLAPSDQLSAVGPFEQWPLGRGFEKYYGFLEALTDQFRPNLVRDNQHIEPPRTPEQGYTLNEDLADNAIQFLTDHISLAPGKPFFLYYSLGAMHSPHQAPDDLLKKYRGHFDDGWDVQRANRLERQINSGVVPKGTVLVDRNDGVEPWDSLSKDQQALYARFEEAYAAFLEHSDTQLGRVFEHLEKLGQKDNTLIFLLSDNGASQEGQIHGSTSTTFYENMEAESLAYNLARLDDIGTERAKNNYPIGWAQVENTPLRRYKQNTHAGGVQDPLIVHWPDGLKETGIRNQFHHVMDIVPTIMEVLETDAPTHIDGVPQMDIHGTSMLYSFNDQRAATRKRAQIFEMFGHRAIWCDGWKAVSWHKRYGDYDDDTWELYDTTMDFSESNDLAEREPERLEKLIELWWSEAGRYDVLPLDDRGFAERRALARPRDDSPRIQESYLFYPGMSYIPGGAAPFIMDRSYSVTANFSAPSGTEGIIATCGGLCGGYALYIKDNQLIHEYNFYQDYHRLVADLPENDDELVACYEFVKTGVCQGDGTLSINGKVLANCHMPRTYRYFMDWEGFSIGRNVGSAVSPAFSSLGTFDFTGDLKHVQLQMGNDTGGPGDYETGD
ncbi:MAG: arylsulfatase [Granulosicoccus sp.]|nr:arylsulfatase [Granulosicoccus sp.]